MGSYGGSKKQVHCPPAALKGCLSPFITLPGSTGQGGCSCAGEGCTAVERELGQVNRERGKAAVGWAGRPHRPSYPGKPSMGSTQPPALCWQGFHTNPERQPREQLCLPPQLRRL